MTNVLNVLTTMAPGRDLTIACTSTRWEPFGRETHHPTALQNRPDLRMKDEETACIVQGTFETAIRDGL